MLALFAALVPLSASGQTAQWRTIARDNFDGASPFPPPPPSLWITYDCSYTSTQGRWSKAGVGYNSPNALHPRGGVTPYNYNTCTWMRYGPFSLVGATNARLLFVYWLDSEVGYDFFTWAYICDGVAGPWNGRTMSGNVGAWVSQTASLEACVGRPNVYVQFTFSSDQSVNYQGVRVDNFRIQKYSVRP